MRALDRRLLRTSRVARNHLALAVLLGLVAALATLAQAILLAHVIAEVFVEHAELADVDGAIAAIVAVAAVRAVVAWGFEASGHLGAARVMSDLRGRLVERLVADRPTVLEGERSGELAAAAVDGVDGLEAYFSRYLPQLALAAFVPLAVLAWVVHVDLVAAAIMAATVPLIPVFMVLIGKIAEHRMHSRWRALGQLSGHFLDVARGLPTLRAYNRAEAQTDRIAATSDAYRRETMGTLRIAFLSSLVLELAAMLGTAMVAVVLGVRLAQGDVAFENALVCLFLAPELYLPLRRLGAQFHASTDGLAAADRLFELAEEKPSSRPAGTVQPPDLTRSSIRLEGVSFAYPSRDGRVLDGIDLELRPGECVALVGANGTGKSTIAALLLGLVEPQEGRVSVGGRDLRELNLTAWRSNLAWVPQRSHLVTGSVAENIRLSEPRALDERVRAAATAAGVLELEAVVGQGGRGLSAGETRRLGLARAFLRDAPLLILDEPTAHLDPRTAGAVAAAIRRHTRGRTTLLITHSASLAAQADRTVRLGAA